MHKKLWKVFQYFSNMSIVFVVWLHRNAIHTRTLIVSFWRTLVTTKSCTETTGSISEHEAFMSMMRYLAWVYAFQLFENHSSLCFDTHHLVSGFWNQLHRDVVLVLKSDSRCRVDTVSRRIFGTSQSHLGLEKICDGLGVGLESNRKPNIWSWTTLSRFKSSYLVVGVHWI